MDVGLCLESVLPAKGGCEHYIGDLARRLHRDGHAVHLYACRWDAAALPETTNYHRLPKPKGPRWRRPWAFAASALEAMTADRLDVTVGFDKTYGQDVLYPQGGLHAAATEQNVVKHPPGWRRALARLVKKIDPATRSYAALERRQYLGADRPMIVVNSEMVRGHFETYYDVPGSTLRVVRSSIDPERFAAADRLSLRAEARQGWGVGDEPVGLFVGMNYRLKGLASLLHAVAGLPAEQPFRLAVVGSPDDGHYRALAKQLGVEHRVNFLGFRADPKAEFFGSDFLVHPTFYDPCSLVALEALACGLPVITTRYNGAAEVLHPPHDGLVIADPHDHASLTAAILKLCDGGRRRDMARRAAQSGREWDFEKHYRQLVAVFREAAEAKAGRRSVAA